MVVCNDCTPFTGKKVHVDTCMWNSSGFYCENEEGCLQRRYAVTEVQRVRGSWMDKLDDPRGKPRR